MTGRSTLPEPIVAAVSRGWSLLPLRGDKRPCVPWRSLQTKPAPLEVLEAWQEELLPPLWGVVTGRASGLVVLDWDGALGTATMRAIGLSPHIATPRGGFHCYVAHPGPFVRTINHKADAQLHGQFPGLDPRGDGGYAAFFGCGSAGPYRSLRDPIPDAWETLPKGLREFLHRRAPISTADLPTEGLEGLIAEAVNRAEFEGRNNAGFTLARRLRDLGYSRSEARAALMKFQSQAPQFDRAGTRAKYTTAEAEASLEQAYKWRPRASRIASRHAVYGGGPEQGEVRDGQPTLTDQGNAMRLVSRHEEDLRFCHDTGKWLTWDGQRWKRDETGEVWRRAKETVRAIYAEASQISADKVRESLVNHARKSEAEPRLRAMIELAKTEPGISVLTKDLDRNPWALNCANGTLELRSGVMRVHRREDLITKLVPVSYVADSRDLDWERVVSDACGGDSELIAFMQRALGYCLTGDTREEKLFFIHGPTAGGKSTIAEAVKATLGDYAVTADFETFLRRNIAGGVRNDIARLAGARLVLSLEVEDGKRLAEGLVKQLTGGDAITARFLYAEHFEFQPQLKLVLVANHVPRVRSDDAAMWRRIVRIPFEHTVPENQRDPELKAKLKDPIAAGAAILAWLMKGCLAWQREGLMIPERVKRATEDYRQEMDPLREFLDERCELSSLAKETSARLWVAYQEFAKDSGERWPLSRKSFWEALASAGLRPAKTGGDRAWQGVALRGPRWAAVAGDSQHNQARSPGTGGDAESREPPPQTALRVTRPEIAVPYRPAEAPSLPELARWDKESSPWLAAEATSAPDQPRAEGECLKGHPEPLETGLGTPGEFIADTRGAE